MNALNRILDHTTEKGDNGVNNEMKYGNIESLYYAARFEALTKKKANYINMSNSSAAAELLSRSNYNNVHDQQWIVGRDLAISVKKKPTSIKKRQEYEREIQEQSPDSDKPHFSHPLDHAAYDNAQYHKTLPFLKGLEQHTKSKSDLYTPMFTRAKGKQKEGLCRICKDPSWFKIKISQYWYHLNMTHGISSSTGYHDFNIVGHTWIQRKRNMTVRN